MGKEYEKGGAVVIEEGVIKVFLDEDGKNRRERSERNILSPTEKGALMHFCEYGKNSRSKF